MSSVEIINMIVYSLAYCCVTFYVSGQYEQDQRFLKYFYIVTLTLFCTQSLASIVGILLCKNPRLSLFTSIGLVCMICSYKNFLVKIEDMSFIDRAINYISFPKLMFNSILITIYGFDRCESHQIPYVLRQFHLKDNQIYWNNSKSLIVLFFAFQAIKFTSLWIRSTRFSLRTIFAKSVESKTSDVFSISDGITDIDMISIDLTETKFQLDLIHQDEQMMLAWTHLTYRIRPRLKLNEIKILDNLNGFITVGSLNAVMGPSGAGKTTLIKCLMSDTIIKNLDKDSTIFVNSKTLQKTCFIKQNDSQYLIKDLTVYQTLLYASQLKNSNESAKVNHKLIVNTLLDDFLIEDTKHTKVRDCSGGQQKRIAIACELTACVRPDLLCIDEPTTGLDSTAAQTVILILVLFIIEMNFTFSSQIVDCLRTLTRNHKMSVIASIHQPNTELLFMFDTVYALARPGICVYSGRPQDLRSHLIECNITCTESEVPIEVMLRVLSSDQNQKHLESLRKRNNELQKCLRDNVGNQDNMVSCRTRISSKLFKLIDFWILLKRMALCFYVSQWKLLVVQFAIIQVIGLNLSTKFDLNKAKTSGCIDRDSFSNETCLVTAMDLDEDSNIWQTIEYNFSILSFVLFLQLILTTLTFPSDVELFSKEHRNGNWSSSMMILI